MNILRMKKETYQRSETLAFLVQVDVGVVEQLVEVAEDAKQKTGQNESSLKNTKNVVNYVAN